MKKKQSIRSWIVVQKNMMLTRKEVIEMKKRKGLRSWIDVMLMAMLAIGMCLLFVQLPAHAAVNCASPSGTADADSDGFTDAQECQGIPLDKGSTPSNIPGKLSGAPRAERLDPDTKDLFVILVPASGSKIPANPLEYVSAPQANGGLGIVVHVVGPTQADSNRYVTSASTQKAVRVTESLDESTTTPLGVSSCGTPNGLDLATVYTRRIEKHVISISGANQDLINKYIKHTIAHEVAHMLGPLAPKYNASYGGYHNKTGTNVVMDQSVYYKGTTLYIGTTYTSADKSGVKLK
jgi:hypothetical protein